MHMDLVQILNAPAKIVPMFKCKPVPRSIFLVSPSGRGGTLWFPRQIFRTSVYSITLSAYLDRKKRNFLSILWFSSFIPPFVHKNPLKVWKSKFCIKVSLFMGTSVEIFDEFPLYTVESFSKRGEKYTPLRIMVVSHCSPGRRGWRENPGS